KLGRIDAQLRHADVRLVRPRVLARERIAQVRVEQHRTDAALSQEPTLAQPPDAKAIVGSTTGHINRFTSGVTSRVTSWADGDVGEQIIMFHHGGDHDRPISLRTRPTPSTMFASFCRAAHRAVCDRPQSGAKTRRSAGAYS